MKTIRSLLRTHTTLTLLVLLGVLGVSIMTVRYVSQANASKDAEHSKAPPIPSVDVETLQPQSIRTWNKFSGRLRAVDYVEVRPRVGGTIMKVSFEDGTLVEKGDSLFVIDPRPFKAEYSSAQAELESARSRAILTQQELKRAKGLVKKKAISQSRFDTAKNDYQMALASINLAKARKRRAYLDLEYAHIKAPVSGRISRAEITEGNVIEAGPNAPILTTIVSINQLYAEFDVDEQTYIKTSRRSNGETMPVELILTSDSSVVYQGKIHSFDNQLNTTSGTIRARAIFDNRDGVLIPGMFVTVRLGSPREESTLLISDRAVRTDQDKKYVYVVTPEKKIAYREVRLGQPRDGKRVVLSGLTSGEQVLVNSLQRVRPEMEVEPVEFTDEK